MSELSHAVKAWNIEKTYVNQHSRDVLGIEYKYTIADTVNDMALSMIETGCIPDKRKHEALK